MRKYRKKKNNNFLKNLKKLMTNQRLINYINN